jgi:hypothetical protein
VRSYAAAEKGGEGMALKILTRAEDMADGKDNLENHAHTKWKRSVCFFFFCPSRQIGRYLLCLLLPFLPKRDLCRSQPGDRNLIGRATHIIKPNFMAEINRPGITSMDATYPHFEI